MPASQMARAFGPTWNLKPSNMVDMSILGRRPYNFSISSQRLGAHCAGGREVG